MSYSLVCSAEFVNAQKPNSQVADDGRKYI
jgi:hypothetical protein